MREDATEQELMSYHEADHPPRQDLTAEYSYFWAVARGYVPEDLLHDMREPEMTSGCTPEWKGQSKEFSDPAL